MTTDTLAMVSYSPPDILGIRSFVLLPQYPSVLRVCVQSPSLQRCRRPCAETCFYFRTMNRRTASKVSRVQPGEGIEGDGDDRGDGGEDGKSCQFLKQRQTLKPSSAPYSLSLDNSPSTRSRASTMFFELVSAFSQTMIKTAQRLQYRLFVFPMYARLPRPTVLSLVAGGTQLRYHFPVEVILSRIQVEKRITNERRSHLLSLGLLHTMRCRLNVQHTFFSLRYHVKPVRGEGMSCCTIFSVAALLIVLALNPRSAHSSRADTLYYLVIFEVCPQSSTNGRVKSSEKESDKL